MALSQYPHFDKGFSLRLSYGNLDWTVHVDLPKFQRLDHNGPTNALKFCKNGPIDIDLCRTSCTALAIRITDSGSGFDESTLPYLMKTFAKGQDHARGAGLGLHICKRLALELRGHFTLRSRSGEGTVFEARIPAEFTTPVDMVTPSPTPDPTDKIDSPGSSLLAPASEKKPALCIRILIVDDNAVCRLVLGKAIKRLDIPIVTAEAENGQSAVAIFASFEPDIVLTDVSMPITDGVMAAQHTISPCRIYAITGLASSDPRIKIAGRNGVVALDGWLVKGHDDLTAVNNIIKNL